MLLKSASIRPGMRKSRPKRTAKWPHSARLGYHMNALTLLLGRRFLRGSQNSTSKNKSPNGHCACSCQRHQDVHNICFRKIRWPTPLRGQGSNVRKLLGWQFSRKSSNYQAPLQPPPSLRAQRLRTFLRSPSGIENFKRDCNVQASHPPNPYFLLWECWRSRLKFLKRDWVFRARLTISSEIDFFQSLGPLGFLGGRGGSRDPNFVDWTFCGHLNFARFCTACWEIEYKSASLRRSQHPFFTEVVSKFPPPPQKITVWSRNSWKAPTLFPIRPFRIENAIVMES